VLECLDQCLDFIISVFETLIPGHYYNYINLSFLTWTRFKWWTVLALIHLGISQYGSLHVWIGTDHSATVCNQEFVSAPLTFWIFIVFLQIKLRWLFIWWLFLKKILITLRLILVCMLLCAFITNSVVNNYSYYWDFSSLF